ncbi:MAG: translation initiation factor IF-3 [Coriobacteriia bacterium]
MRLVDEEGNQLGVFNTSDALDIADERGLDLVEVAPNADPPVARIMDYGKYKYEQDIKAKRARKHQTTVHIKEIKFRPKIDDHDYETKKRHVERFLKSGAKVKVTIMFRGREMTHPELGLAILDRLAEDVRELGERETDPKMEGRNMHMMIAPVKQDAKKAKAVEEPVPAERDDEADESAEPAAQESAVAASEDTEE